jgi:hypothetical protein
MAMKVAEEVLTDIQVEAAANAAGGIYSNGRLADSIRRLSGPTPVGTTVTGSVGSRLSYAASVEGGAGIHPIFPKGAPHVYRFGVARRPMLKFTWHGRTVYMNQIPGGPGTVGRSHPGQRGKHYMVNALLGVALRRGLRVRIFDL